MLGVALGCIGLRYEDFCRLEFPEFEAIWKAYNEQRDTNFKDRWQRMRLLATILVQPYLDKGHSITAEELLSFPWDHEEPDIEFIPTMTAEQQRKRMEELVAKLGDTLV